MRAGNERVPQYDHVKEGAAFDVPGGMTYGGSVIAFIEDRDGCKIELIERA